MNIFIFRNKSIDSSKNIAFGIREFLTNNGCQVIVDDEDAKLLDATPLSKINKQEIDILITLGGDGTMLRAVHTHPDIEAPILGINLGSLGFMAEVPIKNIYPSLEQLIKKNFKVQERIMMEGDSSKNNSCFAINEISFHRYRNSTLVELVIHVDGVYLNTFSADGIIVATPCGSTAYSLAAGGPILSPELDAFILTPISPHTISNRPIVLMPKKEIQVQYISELSPIEIASDGLASFEMETGDVFHIRRSKKKYKLVILPHHDYFATLRTKLGWSGKLRI